MYKRQQQYCHPNHVGVILWFFLRFLNPVSLCLFIASIGETEDVYKRQERKRLEARNQEIDGMILSLYTDKAKGILTE